MQHAAGNQRPAFRVTTVSQVTTVDAQADDNSVATAEIPTGLAEGDPTPGPPPRSITAELEQSFQKISEMASFPAVARKVLAVAGQQEVSTDDMLEVVEQDPALALRILQTVNSSYYGLRNTVADLRSGITLLGIKQVRNIALTVVVGKHFAKPTNVGSIDPARLWDHSVSTAAAARLIANKTKAADPEEAYLAGLIHDSGLLAIDQHMEDEIPRILVRFKSNRSWMEAEQDVLSFDHAQLGAYIAWRSGFPFRLVAAVDYHHQPTQAPEEISPLACVVAVSNYFVTRMGRSVMDDRRLSPPQQRVFDLLQLSRIEVRDLWTELEELLETVGELKAL